MRVKSITTILKTCPKEHLSETGRRPAMWLPFEIVPEFVSRDADGSELRQHGLDGLAEIAERKRLVEAGDFFLVEKFLKPVLDDIAGHGNDAARKVRPGNADPIKDLASVQAGHLEIAADGVEFLRVQLAQRGLAAAGGKHFVTVPLQVVADHFEQDFLVVNQKNFFAGAFVGVARDVGGSGHDISRSAGRIIGYGQFDGEGRSLAGLAAGNDAAAMFFDEAVAQAQAEAGAFADFLGGEKRVEDALQIFRRNARAVVLNRDADDFAI